MPTSVAICTSIFEAARPFAPAYILGIQDFVSALGSAPRIILANDGFADPQQLRRGLPAVSQVVDASGRGIGGVRHRMLEAAMAAECDVIVFCDFDDRLLPGAVGHLDALDDADISYGDLELIDTGGNVLAQSFFGGAGIPNEAKGPEVLLNRNFLGFSNTAVRRSALTPAVIDIPDALPTADWWFFSMMLEAGATARRCSGAVAQYRQHGANTLGGRPSPAPEAVLVRCRLFLTLLAALPANPARDLARCRVARLADAIAQRPEHWAPILRQVYNQPGAWFDELDRAATRMCSPGS